MHALPTTPGAILGYRRNGQEIRLIAGASPEGDPPAGAPAQDPPANPPTAPPADPTKDDGTDWKAMARQWEKRAKDNSTAAKELEKLRAQSMTETEKAVAAARKEGATEAARTYGRQLAAAELRAAASAKGVDLSELGDLLDVARFVDDAGEVDTDAIGKAVGKLARLAKPSAPPRGSGEFDGGSGAGQPITEEQLARMTPAEKVAALEAGKLAHLL